MINDTLKLRLFCLLRLIVGGVYLLCSLSILAKEMSWLAYGDLRGHIESCGCDPKTDLGGLARLSLFLQRERSQFSDIIVFDLGNNFSLKD